MTPSQFALVMTLACAVAPLHGSARPAHSGAREARQELERQRHESEHFVVEVFGGSEQEVDELARLLEQAHGQFERALDVSAPDLSVTVRVLPDREAWLARLRLEGGALPLDAEGVVYWHPTKTAYVERQSNAYETRAKVLHGAFQAFHAQVKPKNADLVRTWYVTGLAEHFAVHHWDGSKLELGVIPIVSSRNLAGSALVLLNPAAIDPSEKLIWLLGNSAIRFGLVRYLLEGAEPSERQAFEKLALGHSGSKLLGADYAEALGKPRAISAKVHRYLSEHQEPLRARLGEWGPIGVDAVEAYPTDGRLTLCASPQPLDELNVRIDLLEPEARAGIALDWVDASYYVWAVVSSDGWLYVVRNDHGSVEFLVQVHLRKDRDRSGHMRAVRHGQQVALVVEGGSYGRFDVRSGCLGLAAEDGRAAFRELSWE